MASTARRRVSLFLRVIALVAAPTLGTPHPALAAPAPPAPPADSQVAPAGSIAVAVDTSAAPGDSLRLSVEGIRRAAASLTSRAVEATPETLGVPARVSVPVFLGGRELFRIGSGRDGLSPEARAAAIRDRLTAAVRDRAVPADSVHLVSTPEGIEFRLGDHYLWTVTPADVEGRSVTEVGTKIAGLPTAITRGVLAERAARRPAGVLISVALALLATLVAWILLRVLILLSRRWRAFLARRLPRHVRGFRFRNFEVFSQAQLVSVLQAVMARLDVLVGVLMLYFYVTSIFSLFPWTQGWGYFLFRFAGEQLLEALRGFGRAVPGLLVIAVIVVVFRWLMALADRFFDAVERGTLTLGGFHPELARPSKRLVRILLWLIGMMVAYPYIPGAQSRAVQGISLLVGVMVSLGSTGVVGNMLAGIVLTYSRSFRVGDRVKIGEQVGDVTSLGFFATKLRTIRNEEVTLPNGQVAGTSILNYTRMAAGDGLVLHTEVTIGYDVDWRRVHALLIEAAGKVEAIEKDPAPRVYQRSLNDSHVSYELTATTRDSHGQLGLYSRLHEEIQDAFARAGVEILSPGYHAIRDANAPVLPAEPKGPRAEPGGFRVRGGDRPGA